MSTSPIPPVLDQDRYAVYQPTAATTDFALGFPLFGEAADVAVYLDGDLLNLTSDYTIRSTANGATLTPAPVTDAYVRLNAPISAGKLEIFGNFRPRRTIQATAPYGTRDFNFAFSLLMAAMREMWTKFTRSLKVPVGEADLTIPNSEERAGQVFAFDDTGKPTIGGRYSDLMSSASAATVAAANALSSARAAAASAEAAATFDPTSYYTTDEVAALLESYVPATRTIASGLGVKINGGASATLASTVTVGLDLATDAETVAGEIDNKPAPPSGIHAAIAAALTGFSAGGIKNVLVITASGTYTPSEGAKQALVIATGAGGGYRNGGTSYDHWISGAGAGATAIKLIDDPVPTTVTIGSGVTYNNVGGNTVFGSIVAGGGAPGNYGSAIVGGGAGGTATGGDINIRGGNGHSSRSVGDSSGYVFTGPGASFWGNAPAWGGGADYTMTTSAPGVVVVLEF